MQWKYNRISNFFSPFFLPISSLLDEEISNCLYINSSCRRLRSYIAYGSAVSFKNLPWLGSQVVMVTLGSIESSIAASERTAGCVGCAEPCNLHELVKECPGYVQQRKPAPMSLLSLVGPTTQRWFELISATYMYCPILCPKA